MDAAGAELEQARSKTKRHEHDARVHEALLAEAQAGQEQRSAALAECQGQLADAQSQLFAAQKRHEELQRELAEQRERVSAGQEETKAQRRKIAHEFKAQHAAHLADLEQHKADLQARLAEAQAGQEQRRTALAECQGQLADAHAQLAAAQRRHEEQRERVSAGQEETKAQRRRIAHEFKAQHAAHLAEIEQRKAELLALSAKRHTQLEDQLAAVNSELCQARQQMAEMRRSLDERSEALTCARQISDALKAETVALRESLQESQAEAGRAADAVHNAELAGGNHDEELAEQHAELAKLRNECERLGAQLADAEDKLKEASKSQRSTVKNEDLQRRFEMAVEELREMKTANAQLESKLAKSRDGGSASVSSNGMDWAAQKQRLLASLEADDDDDEEAVVQRQTIEGTIRITDQIVAQKDLEIAELKRRLEEQSQSPALSAASRDAAAEALDHDELIRQEREKLQQVQAEWRERIGKAEIDISMERAKIARDRAELEEKMRCHQREQATRTPEDPQGNNQGKPVRGRWLARLGLKELGDQ